MSVQVKGSGTIGGIDEGLNVVGVTTITGSGEYLLKLNKSDSSAVYAQFTNSTSGTSTTDGFRIGMDSNEDGLVWLREDGNVKFGSNNLERLRINSDGKVGLGTTGSEYGLSIREADNNNKWLMLQKNSGQELLQIREDGDNHVIIDGSHASGELHFYTAGSERLRITSAGHLQLQGGTIYGDDSALPTFTLQNTSGNNNHCKIILGSSVGADNGGIEFWTAGSSVATKKFSIRGNNNYIEVIGSNTLRFNDGKLNVSHDGSDGYITNNTGDIKLRTNNAERLEITSDGLIQAKTLSGSYYPIASVKDGSTSARAATSAWEIKKTLGPRAKTGYYYLINPYDSSINTWWCDMTTDGGGWILIAHSGEGNMADQGTTGAHWWSRNNKGGFDTVGSGYYTGGGYWRTSAGAWAANTCGQLMWDVRTHLSEFNNKSNDKVVFNWGTDQAIPSGNSSYSNIPNAGNRRFADWCYAVENAPGYNPSQYHQNVRSTTLNGANHFTEHMVMTWSMRGTGGAGDGGENGPYWMIGSHANGLHQHYEESLSGDANGDGSYQVVSNEDTGWGGGGTNNGYRRIARNADAGTCNIWLR